MTQLSFALSTSLAKRDASGQQALFYTQVSFAAVEGDFVGLATWASLSLFSGLIVAPVLELGPLL